MKRASLFVLLLTFTLATVLHAQQQDSSYKENIRKEFTEYLLALELQDFEKATTFMPAAFFKIYPKETFLQLMEQVYNSSEYSFEIKNSKILSVDDKLLIDKVYYAKARYSNMLHMKFPSVNDESTINLMLSTFKQTFGEDNVYYNTETTYFEIYVEKDVIAQSENGEKEWKFIAIEKEQMPLLEKILPKQIIDNL